MYLSGFLGRDINTGRIPSDPAAQVQLSLDRMLQTLKAAGLDFRHMVFINPYLTKNIPMNVMNCDVREAFRVWQHAGSGNDSGAGTAERGQHGVHRRGRAGSRETKSGSSEEHGAEPDGESVCIR